MSLSTAFDDKERVKQATDIVDLVGSYLQLQRQGGNYVAVCPWHDDHRPSLQVNPARQSWKCWVCDIQGDVFSFVMRRENIDFREALELLADRQGIQLSGRHGPKTVAGNPNDKPTLYKAMQWVVDQYHDFLLDDSASALARDYLEQRGIAQSAIEAFKIGYAPNSWTWLIDRAQGVYSPEILQACGIASKSERKSSWFERFRGRVMFPVFDIQGRPIAFGGRILPELAAKEESETGRPPAKYINSPETKLYSKSDHLYGLNVARDSLSQEGHLIIVEGYTDVISAWLAGVENTAAVCGTSLGNRHLRVIRRLADRITLVLDGDAAGQRRANEILDVFVASDVDVRILTLPQGQDPCDYLQTHGAGEFRRLISQAVDALDHKIAIETHGLDLIRDTHRSHQALDRILTTLASSPARLQTGSDTRLRHQQILTRLAQIFQLDLATLRERIGALRSRQARSSNQPPARATGHVQPRQMERELLQIALQDFTLLREIVENISPNQFVDSPCREIYEFVCQCYHTGQAVDFETLMVQLEEPLLKDMLIRLDDESRQKQRLTDVDLSRQLQLVLQAFERDVQDRRDRQEISTLLNPEIDDQEESQILEQLFQESKRRRGI